MVVRDVPCLVYFFALVFLAEGVAIGRLGFREGGSGLVMPTLISVGFSAMLLLLSPITITTFDRRGNAYEVLRKGILRRTVTAGPLSDVAGVYSDEALTDRTYRVVLMLNSGAQLPLSRWWTYSRRRSERLAQRITAFLVLGGGV